MAKLNIEQIQAVRNKVLLSDENVANTIHDIRGEKAGDKEIYEHVEKAIRQGMIAAIRESGDFDEDDDDEDFDFNFDGESSTSTDGETETETGTDIDKENDDDDDESLTDFGGEDDGNDLAGSYTAQEVEKTAEDIEKIKSDIITKGGLYEAGAVRRMIETTHVTFECRKSDYQDIIDRLYQEAIDKGNHRDTYNVLSFIKFMSAATTPDFTAAFAFLDIPNTDLSEVFSEMAGGNQIIRCDGFFFNSTFNNDSVLAWPWTKIKYSNEMFTGCPYSNLEINDIAHRRILKVNGVSKTTSGHITAASAKIDAILKSMKK